MLPKSKSEMSKIVQDLYQIIECAFGSELENDTYLFLLYYLYENAEMTMREVGAIVGAYIGKDYLHVYHDVLGIAEIDNQISVEQQEKFETQLKTCGFDDWLVEWLKALNPPADNESG